MSVGPGVGSGEEGQEAAFGRGFAPPDQQSNVGAGQVGVCLVVVVVMVEDVSGCLEVATGASGQDTWSSREGLVWSWRGGKATCLDALLRLGLKRG